MTRQILRHANFVLVRRQRRPAVPLLVVVVLVVGPATVLGRRARTGWSGGVLAQALTGRCPGCGTSARVRPWSVWLWLGRAPWRDPLGNQPEAHREHRDDRRVPGQSRLHGSGPGIVLCRGSNTTCGVQISPRPVQPAILALGQAGAGHWAMPMTRLIVEAITPCRRRRRGCGRRRRTPLGLQVGVGHLVGHAQAVGQVGESARLGFVVVVEVRTRAR